MGLGGLFAGGIPKLKSAGERGKPGTGGMKEFNIRSSIFIECASSLTKNFFH